MFSSKTLYHFFVLIAFSTIGCGESGPQATPQTKAQYAKYCARCHEIGAANAPKRGDAHSWAKRQKKGQVALLLSVKKGLVAMPPKGGCEECSDEDLVALIRYMSH